MWIEYVVPYWFHHNDYIEVCWKLDLRIVDKSLVGWRLWLLSSYTFFSLEVWYVVVVSVPLLGVGWELISFLEDGR